MKLSWPLATSEHEAEEEDVYGVEYIKGITSSAHTRDMWAVGGGHSWGYKETHQNVFSESCSARKWSSQHGNVSELQCQICSLLSVLFIHIHTHTPNFKAKMGFIKDAIGFCFLWKNKLQGEVLPGIVLTVRSKVFPMLVTVEV